MRRIIILYLTDLTGWKKDSRTEDFFSETDLPTVM